MAKKSKSTERRHRIALAAAERGCSCAMKGLPMPYGAARTKITVRERFHYEWHRRHHLAITRSQGATTFTSNLVLFMCWASPRSPRRMGSREKVVRR